MRKEGNFTITIVGLGLIGGSYALALKELNPDNLYAVDINEESLKYAIKNGIIDRGYTDPKEPLKESDLVIIGLYPDIEKKFVIENINYFKKGAIITDVTGIKSKFVNEMNELLREDIDFVFGHPMAGRESQGIQYASKEVFKGANYIITPTERNKKENIDFIESIVKKIGFKNVEKITPERHDEIIGFASQLPHVIAVSLVNSDKLGTDIGRFTGDSYRELTRIAKINEKLWSELFIGNKENLIREIEEFENNIKELKTAIVEENLDELYKILVRATKKREEMS